MAVDGRTVLPAGLERGLPRRIPKADLANVRSQVPAGYVHLLKEIKDRIQQSQTRAVFSVNAELIGLYRDIGRMIDDRQRKEGCGAAVIPRLARDFATNCRREKGYSERNIKRMLAFYRPYRDPAQCHGLLHN